MPRSRPGPKDANGAPAAGPRGGLRLERWAPAAAGFVAFLLYASTLGHGYALDDGMVITGNRFTTQGIAGIGELLTRDSFAGALGSDQVLDQGRYRPLSLVTFALEWQLFRRNPAVGHGVNVLLYALTAVLLFRVVRSLGGGNPGWAAATTALFVVHPVHTEVVANIKSRDELLVFLFFLIVLDRFSRVRDLAHWSRAWLGGLAAFILALFSKESAVLFPVLLAAGLWTWGRPARSITKLFLVMSVLTAGFLGWRYSVVDPGAESLDLMNNPYLGASVGQKYATIAIVLLRYLGLLFWPARLSYDYSIWQIPLCSSADPVAWVSLVLHVGMLVLMLDGIRRRRAYGFGLLVYSLGLLPVSNLLINVGAPMGERFLYLPSFGFFLALLDLTRGVVSGRGGTSFDRRTRNLAVGLLVAVSLAGATRTIARNRDWSSEATLFLADVKNAPNSAKTNKGAADIWINRGARERDPAIRREDLERAVRHLERALQIYPDYAFACLDLGMAHRLRGETERAELLWRRYLALRPKGGMKPKLDRLLADSYFQEGRGLDVAGRRDEAVVRYRAALRIDPAFAEAARSLGRILPPDSLPR